MTQLTRLFLLFGSVSAALAVALGAFGAHGLKSRLTPELMVTWQTAVQYHFYHALGLFAVAGVAALLPASAAVKWSGWLMVAGILLFSGSLYALALTGVRGLGAITPLGGVAFIIAWVLLGVAALST